MSITSQSYKLDVKPEQPEQGLDVTDFCKPVDPDIAKCVADHWWELLDDENAADEKVVKEFSEKVSSEITRQVKDTLAKQTASEELEKDFEKEIDKTVNECTNGYDFDWEKFARHFYELGLNSKK